MYYEKGFLKKIEETDFLKAHIKLIEFVEKNIRMLFREFKYIIRKTSVEYYNCIHQIDLHDLFWTHRPFFDFEK